MKDSYDVIVVGAGPAGSTTARYAASNGVSVLVLEKDREVGIPVRCAEGVGELGLRAVIEPQERWLANKIIGVRLVAPNGKYVQIENEQTGYVLNRKIFDYDLAQMAAQAGAHILTKAYVWGLIIDEQPSGGKAQVRGVRVRYLGQDYELRAKVVVGADGVESRVGRWAGLRKHFKMHDMETCVQMTVGNMTLDAGYCHFYFGRNIAPGGYLWVFPKGNGVANVGLGLSGDYSGDKSPLRYLAEFVEKNFPGAAILTTVAGGVPCAPALKKLVGNGVMLVGDAAHQANPISGGGIVRAMIAGQIAGRVAAEAVKEDNVSAERLEQYSREWYKGEGKTHNIFYRLKEGIYKLTDEDLNKAAEILLTLPPEKRTLVNIFKAALINQPGLIMDAIKVFVSS